MNFILCWVLYSVGIQLSTNYSIPQIKTSITSKIILIMYRTILLYPTHKTTINVNLSEQYCDTLRWVLGKPIVNSKLMGEVTDEPHGRAKRESEEF